MNNYLQLGDGTALVESHVIYLLELPIVKELEILPLLTTLTR